MSSGYRPVLGPLSPRSVVAVATTLATLGAGCFVDWDALSVEHGVPRACAAFVVAADTHSCARLTDGSLRCWGDNRFGQLGVGDTASRATPTPVSLSFDVGKIYVPTGEGELSGDRAAYTCALSTKGELHCFGDNRLGQLGVGDREPRARPTLVAGLPSIDRASLGAGHTCAVSTEGALSCFGANQYGQLGDGTKSGALAPTAVTGLTTGVASVAAGGFHTCALRTDGTVLCWGQNDLGQLGSGPGAESTTPKPLDLGARVTRIFAGAGHSCAIVVDGSVRCWGDNRFGQLGSGDTAAQTKPVTPKLSNAATQVYLGRQHTCALLGDASLVCFGANRFGQLGTGDTMAHPEPVRVGMTALADGVSAAYAGGAHTCAITTKGALYCFGNNQYAQLGVSGETSGVPALVLPACR